MDQLSPGDFYCSEKFTWLSVDLEKRQTFSCCAARPEQVNINWIKQNPGQLFNTPSLQNERQQMLDNQPVSSCEDVCWRPENIGTVSRRMIFSTQKERFDSIQIDAPKNLHIMLGSTCNMTCSYCCKNYSTAWLRDINEHGSYLEHDRFIISPMDKLLLKISQPEHQASTGYITLTDEIERLRTTDCVYITGGETFLYNNLVEMVNKISEHNQVKIYTGLGVDPIRFEKQLTKLKNRNRITLIVSAENCGPFYEFNRFGNTWENFEINLKQIEQQGFEWYFSCVLSNLTIFGFFEFVEQFKGKHIKYEFCSEPEFLNVNVLDADSKHALSKLLNNSEIEFRDIIIQTMMAPVTEQQQQTLSVYLKEFARRRNLDFSIYPASFVNWIQNA
jgi:hypothetical protein